MDPIGVGIVGLGQWGRNYLRILSDLEGAQVVACSDLSSRRLRDLSYDHSKSIRATTDATSIFRDREIRAVVLASPSSSHYALGMAALRAGKDLLVEKPLAREPRQADAMVRLAEKNGCVLMVGHTYLFHPVVRKMKEYLKKQYLGRFYYFHSQRTNLGPIRSDVNTVLDLAPHDISILMYLLERRPDAVQAVGVTFLNNGLEDAVSMTLHFPKGIKAFVHVSWLEPLKIRNLIAVGERRMVVFNDMNSQEPLRIYDKYVEAKRGYEDFGQFRTIVRDGDVRIPYIASEEPLKNQCRAFLEAVRTRKVLQSDGKFGADVVRVLSKCQKSLRLQGRLLTV